MRNQKSWTEEKAVSPVVGVMLMLVVTIIIAAVVSAFSGGIIKTTEKAPALSVETRIYNNGMGNSYFRMTVVSAGQVIPSRDLEIITSWTNSSGTSGGTTVYPNSYNSFYRSLTSSGTTMNNLTSPIGYGAGVSSFINEGGYDPNQSFGQYSLVTGTIMQNFATNYNDFQYNSSWTCYKAWYSSDTCTDYNSTVQSDGMTAILGPYWNTLRMGDKVNVKVLHIPSKKVIVDQNVVVEG